MSKKNPSNAIKKAVESVVTTDEAVEKGTKQFNSTQYLEEYLAEVKNSGTWESLCERTGFTLANVRQCITMLRSDYRKAKITSASESAAFLKSLKAAGKDIEVWADEKATEKFPYMGGKGTRNTVKSKMISEWANEELSL